MRNVEVAVAQVGVMAIVMTITVTVMMITATVTNKKPTSTIFFVHYVRLRNHPIKYICTYNVDARWLWSWAPIDIFFYLLYLFAVLFIYLFDLFVCMIVCLYVYYFVTATLITAIAMRTENHVTMKKAVVVRCVTLGSPAKFSMSFGFSSFSHLTKITSVLCLFTQSWR